MLTGVKWCTLSVLVAAVSGARWQWPETAQSVRIDSKVKFTDTDKSVESRYYPEEQLQDTSFREPSDTDGFYNRPPGEGRFPVEVRDNQQNVEIISNGRIYNNARKNGGRQLASDGTLDSLQYCKCVSISSRCDSIMNSDACGLNQRLCCSTMPRPRYPNSEIFNEVNDERPSLYPGKTSGVGSFPPPGSNANGVFGSDQEQHNLFLAPVDNKHNVFGNRNNNGNTQHVLVGPDGPTGIIGPKKPILVGPEGPTGVIGPGHKNPESNSLFESAETAQRGVLVGPGGPTGIIGPSYTNRPVLVGPGGPTGIIGPRRPAYRGSRPGILVGPGGPTGTIGPGRPILVGPGGPTGIIGPRGYGCPHRNRNRQNLTSPFIINKLCNKTCSCV